MSYTLEQVKQHSRQDDLWIVLHNKSNFLLLQQVSAAFTNFAIQFTMLPNTLKTIPVALPC